MIASNPLPSEDAPQEPKTHVPVTGTRLRGVILGVCFGLALGLASLGAWMVMHRDQAPRLTRPAYDAALGVWKENGPADYDLDIELTGNRPGKIRVKVRKGEVVSMARDGVEPRQRRTWDVWSVPGMFDTLEQELDMAANPAKAFNTPSASEMIMWADFDPKLGYPKKYDRVVLGADFEVHWQVTRFAPR